MITTIDPTGKYLAGLNGVTGTFQGQKLSGETYMKLAGAYQQRELFKTTLGVPLNAIGIITKGTAYGPSPYYGEQPYSGRMILKGIQNVNLRP